MKPPVRALGVLAAVVAIGAAVVFGAQALGNWASNLGDPLPGDVQSDVPAGTPVDIVIPAGATARGIGELLAEQGVVRSSNEFELAVRAQDAGSQLKAGEYQLVTGMEISDVLTVLIVGPEDDTYRLVVREGLWIEEILDALAEGSGLPRSDFQSALLGGSVESSLLQGPATELEAWEGLLFPATYEFFDDASADEILQRLATTMEQRVEEAWPNGLPDGLTEYQGIIIASLIEAETRVETERPLVSSVIDNRLDLGMPLGIDATLVYALGERGAPNPSQVEDSDPFNSRTQIGLPPRPIGAPGLASLQAAAEPAETEFLYYVLTSLDGTHSFTADYDQFINWKNQARADGIIP